jgi:hypothetical protein
MKTPRQVLLMLLYLTLTAAWAGEIIFVDPVREKAESLPKPPEGPARHELLLERTLNEARQRSGRGTDNLPVGESTDPASLNAREARGALDGQSPLPPPAILRSGTPSSDASKARQTARNWVAPPNNSGNKTENTVGGIEGATQGHTVIQGTTRGVSICK